MNSLLEKNVIGTVIEAIGIPDSAYERAVRRYKDLGGWFGRDEALCFRYDPQIYPQGSFRLGTVNRPVEAGEEYDLDLGCRLRSGVNKTTHTQEQLKAMVHSDLVEYRKARGILRPIEEKNRCWCLHYADELSFHMDVVPSIPEDLNQQFLLRKSMIEAGRGESLATNVARHAGAITDRRDPRYRTISSDWHISNSEGYALWFEEKMRTSTSVQRLLEKALKVEELPTYRWRSPLQQCVQILKRHRDVMFGKNDNKPISIIITTLAAAAYNGESDVESAVENVLERMEYLVNPTTPRVPNPVNPREDFADKWASNPQLETNFRNWLRQAQEDFRVLRHGNTVERVMEKSLTGFGVPLDCDMLTSGRGISTHLNGLGVTSGTRVVTPASSTNESGRTGPRPLKDNPYF